jgi:ketosteroid isomerase-like protein
MCKSPLRITILSLMLIMPGISLAEFHFQKNATDEISEADRQLALEITEFLAAYEKVYNNQDYRAVKAMWAKDGNPIYMAEEVPFPLYGQQRLDNYFNPVPGKKILEGIDNRYSEVRAKSVAPNVAVATYKLDYDLKLMGMAPVHGWNRIMAVFVKEGGDWKMSAYTEAPMGPGSMVRRMMKEQPPQTPEEEQNYAVTKDTIKQLSESLVSPGFDEFLDAQKDIEPTH